MVAVGVLYGFNSNKVQLKSWGKDVFRYAEISFNSNKVQLKLGRDDVYRRSDRRFQFQ